MHGSKNLGVPPPNPDLLPLWQEVLDLADAVRAGEPWRHSTVNAVLGVRDPASGEIDWCSIMGHDRQTYGVAIYSGDAGYATLDRLLEGAVEEFDEPIAQLATVLTFTRSAEVLAPCKAILKQLGRQYRGAHAWPELLRHVPGYMPVPPDDAVALRRVAHTLRGLLALLPRLAGELRGGVAATAGHAFVLEPPFVPGNVQERPLPRPAPAALVVPTYDRLATRRIGARSGLPQGSWYIDWFTGVGVIDGPEAGGRPYFTAHLLVLDLRSDMLLKMDLCRVEQVPAQLQTLLIDGATAYGPPAEVVVRRPAVAEILREVAEDLGSQMRLDRASVAVTRHFMADMLQFFGR